MTHNSQHRSGVESGKFVSSEQLNENNNLKTKQSNYQNNKTAKLFKMIKTTASANVKTNQIKLCEDVLFTFDGQLQCKISFYALLPVGMNLQRVRSGRARGIMSEGFQYQGKYKYKHKHKYKYK